jgi:hypothetical protein
MNSQEFSYHWGVNRHPELVSGSPGEIWNYIVIPAKAGILPQRFH